MPWHRLLAALPDDAVVILKPVVPPTLADDPVVSPIAGWRQVTCELSAGKDGLRHLMVVLDATGRPISAGDHVLTCRPVDGDSTLTRFEHESIGGRLEEDGTFNGTHWLMVYERPEDSEAEDYQPIESRSRKPTDDETAVLKSLVVSLLLLQQALGRKGTTVRDESGRETWDVGDFDTE